ncbi:substrate-binding domain-containing protein [Streptomyces sp. NBC_00536]|uniref:substrate-binding domain-containing protein n=1 Tax=Streptomyces sp. NBC_00536 TaxID=2975769 RepID=UPI002E7FF202|nr:substrate-binding domain-containing protein [Streptomyces sp. NBC_00536]WUC77214.1 substrate-binding domain-containing protein [Streptomyces sp. NBC_00536]
MHPSSPLRSLRRAAALSGVLALALTLGACSSGKPSGGGGGKGPADGPLSIAYLQKQGDQEYFVSEAAGAQRKADELGIKLRVVNLGNDASKTITEVKSAAAQKNQGIIIVVPESAVGPQVVAEAKNAGIALLTSDDQVCANGPKPADCDEANLVPRVGFSGLQMGNEVGKRAAAEFLKAGWSAADTRIIYAWKQDTTVCTDRVNGAKAAWKEAGGPEVQAIEVGTDNTPAGAQAKVEATVTANQGVKHWVVMGCNDENVSGGVKGLGNAGVKGADIVGIGLGAYLACKDWQAGADNGMKAALYIPGDEVGKLAVQAMYDKLKNGKEFAPESFAPTRMVDAGTWKDAGFGCK